MRTARGGWLAAAWLAACACQASPPAADHPLLGTWQLVLPVSKCVETYEYRADGTSHTVSAGEETDTVYEVSAMPDAHGYYVLKDTIKKTNAKPDCSGQLTPTDKPVTLSIGVAAASPGESTRDYKVLAERLIAEADAALYRAKSAGRNRIATSPNLVT